MNLQVRSPGHSASLVLACWLLGAGATLCVLAARPPLARAQLRGSEQVAGRAHEPSSLDSSVEGERAVSPLTAADVSAPYTQVPTRDWLTAIDVESRRASIAYVWSAVLLGTALALVGGALAIGPGTGGSSCSFLGGCSGGGGGQALGVFSAIAGLGSLVTFIVGLVLDVDSGGRRGAWQARQRSAVAWRLDGGPGDVGVGVAGEF